MTEHVASPDGIRIAFERTGAGPALLLHCLPGDHHYWRKAGYLDAHDTAHHPGPCELAADAAC